MSGPKRKSVFETIISNISIGSGCWIWRGSRALAFYYERQGRTCPARPKSERAA